MEIAALALAVVALVIALAARSQAAGLARKVEDAERESRRAAAGVGEEAEEKLATLRRLMAEMARGAKLTPEMIEEGRLWREASAEDAIRMLAEGGVHVVDVRTPQETAGGILPGAQRIPIDEIESRFREIPKGKRTLVYCAGGGRSAAACEFLSQKGYESLYNLAGGITSWTGPVERPAAERRT